MTSIITNIENVVRNLVTRVDRPAKALPFVTGALPSIPESWDWTTKVASWGLDGNDAIGDCAEVGTLDNLFRIWASVEGRPWTPTSAEVQQAYSTITGYNPSNPSTDQGSIEADVLNFAKKTGLEGHTIDAWAGTDPHDIAKVKLGIYLCGGAVVGLDLPRDWQSQASLDEWDYTGQPADGGGHEVVAAAYNARGIKIVTWAQTKWLTWAYVQHYMSDIDLAISRDWFNEAGVSPTGLNVDELIAAISNVGKVQ